MSQLYTASEIRGAIHDTVSSARAVFDSGRTRPLEWRRRQIEAIVTMMIEASVQIETALAEDLGKNPVESHATEISSVVAEAKHALKRLKRWTRDKRVGVPFVLGPAKAYVHREPLGTVLIISAWNYPVNVTFMPLIGAIAAGNTVVVKPSEVAPACSRLFAELIPAYLDAEAIKVVEGGVEETTELLRERFDHILYTGNGRVASIVMEAAAKHLTPVTLELGGKSPVWVDDSYPLTDAAKTIAWGKFANAGQTCIAPDYVLTTPNLAAALADEVGKAARDFYGDDPQQSPDYSRIVNRRHAERLRGLLGSGRVVHGGAVDLDDRYVSPTVLTDVRFDDPVMDEEIFGPILPIVAVPDHRAAIATIRSMPKPLALYGFTRRPQVRDDLTNETSSGALVFGSVLVHAAMSTLPFGGVGASGMGSYHGEFSMRTFSHERAVMRRLPGPDLVRLARPPYTARKAKLLGR